MNNGYIYYFRASDFIYVGATRSPKRREWIHRGQLKKGAHHNPVMQSLYDAGEVFTFEIAESGEWSDDELSAKEIAHEQKLRAEDRVKLLNTQACGQVMREQQRRRLSEAMSGRKKSDEQRRKISEAHAGKRLSDEHKKKLSEARRGKKPAPISDEAKKRMSEAKSHGPVMCIETGKIYISAAAAAKEHGWNTATGILGCIAGKRKSAGGLHWKAC